MVLDQLGVFQTQQFKNISKTSEEKTDQWIYQAQMDKLFSSHNHVLTRILQNGLKIPQELVEKVKRQAIGLKRIYFGLDNFIVDPHLIPKDQGGFVILKTETMPIILPQVFFKEDVSQDSLLTRKVVINLIEEKKWWELDADTVLFPDFLKAGLVFFSPKAHVKKEPIRMAQVTTDPFLPEHAVIFSLKCNFFTLLLFFFHHQEYFTSIQAGLATYLKFVNTSK